MQRSNQAPGMMRHGPFPGGLGPAGHHRPLELLPPPELLENKLAAQAADTGRLLRENQRLAATHVAMRQDLVATQQELQRIQAHAGSVQTESDIQVRGLLEKIGKMEADIRAGEMVRKELQQAHLEMQSLITARQELTAEIQRVTEELQKVNDDTKRLPGMHTELGGLRQEHQKLRAAFEYEKGSNMEQVEQMRGMEKNLISLAREVEKLRADVMKAEKGAQAPNAYPGTVYPPAGQGGGYTDHGYGQGRGYVDGGYVHGAGYSNAGFGHGGPAGYLQAYGRSQPPMVGGAAEGMHAYGGVSGAGYGRPQVPMAGGAAAATAAGEGMNPYGGAYNTGRGGSVA